MPVAFLTGATGFVGAHVARALGAHGWRVRALARRPGACAFLREDGRLELDEVAGDLAAECDLTAALSGVDAIVHVAGLVKARSLEAYRAVNVRGTQRILSAAARSCPEATFLLVSSQAAAGPARDAHAVAEEDPARPVSWYGVSKREAEEAVRRDWRGPWTILRPGVIYGPGDRGLFVYFRMAARGWLPVPAGRARIQVIGAERTAEAVARSLAAEAMRGRTGFLCDPDPVRVEDLARMIAALPRKRARLFPVPDLAVRALGAWESVREAITGRSRPFNADKARELLAGDWLCDGAPTTLRLGLPAPAPLADGLRRAWEWYRAAGWLAPAGHAEL